MLQTIWLRIAVLLLLILFCLPAGAAFSEDTDAPPAQVSTGPILSLGNPTERPDTYDYTAIDSYALNTPEEYGSSVERLAAYLCRTAQNDREKARALFDWVAAKIAYDSDNRPTGKWEQRPDAVLQIRYTDCGGHARLFKRLADLAGLQAEYILGALRGSGLGKGRYARGLHYESHAWNAVKIDGEWKLLDTTAAATLDRRNGHFSVVRALDTGCFGMSGARAIYTYYPDDSRWQLLPHPLTRAEHERLPYIHQAFFQYGLSLEDQKESQIRCGSSLSFTLAAPANCSLLADLYQGGRKLEEPLTFVQREGVHCHVYAVFPAAGAYEIQIWARRLGDDGYHELALEYEVKASAGSPPLAGLPRAFEVFYDHGGRLDGPSEGYLLAGRPQLFQVTIPGAASAGVKSGEQIIPLQKQGDTFAGYVTLSPGEILLTASFPFRPGFNWALVQYTAR